VPRSTAAKFLINTGAWSSVDGAEEVGQRLGGDVGGQLETLGEGMGAGQLEEGRERKKKKMSI